MAKNYRKNNIEVGNYDKEFIGILVILAIIAITFFILFLFVSLNGGGVVSKLVKDADISQGSLEEMGFETVADWHHDVIDSPYIVVLRHMDTDVLYAYTSRGGMELMVKEDGSPMTYKEYKENEDE